VLQLRSSLLGLNWAYRNLWNASKKDLVIAMKNEYERHAKACATDRHEIRRVLYFLQTESADGIVLDGIIWVADSVPYEASYFWGDAQKSIVEFVDWAWRNKEAEIRQSVMAFEAVKTILGHLAGLQNKVALILLDSIGSAN
jgi:hypothetical protein